MNAGERAIAKEMKRQAKERQRRIELANKMLIPVGKKTNLSLGIISLDPSGVVRMENNRWLKIYRLEGNLWQLADVLENLTGRVRITWHKESESGRISCHMTLIENGEIYEEIRQSMAEDEAVIKEQVNICPLTIDEAMTDIANQFRKDVRFSYASYVRGNKDWKKEIYSEAKEETTSFSVGSLYGECFSILNFPKHCVDVISQLDALLCEMYVCVDLNALTEEEHADYKRAMEKKYNRRLPICTEERFINLSLSILIFTDSDDARKIIEETVRQLMYQNDILLTPCYHRQKAVMESILSLGITEEKNIRNVDKSVVKKVLGGETDADAKIEV